MKFKKGEAVALRGDLNFIGVIVHNRKDRCGQIPVWWVTWHGKPFGSAIFCDPYKLMRLLPTWKPKSRLHP